MNRQQLVSELSEKTGFTKASCDQILRALTETISEAMKKGDAVQLIGFGTFTTAKRAARTGKNPKTGEAIKIPASVMPKFKPGKALKELMNTKKKK